MKLYSAHRSPASLNDDVVFIKEGFSWPAFLFSAVWLLVKRLWLAFVVYVAVVMLISSAVWALGLPRSVLCGLLFLVNLWLGMEGNELLRRAAARRGYVEVGASLGRNLEEAELRYFSRPPVVTAPGDAGPLPGAA